MWPERVRFGELVLALADAAAAREKVAHCREDFATLGGHLDDTASGGFVRVYDENPASTAVQVFGAVDRFVVAMSWHQVGSISDPEPALRAWEIQQARLRGEPEPEPVAAPAPVPLPDTEGYLTAAELHHPYNGHDVPLQWSNDFQAPTATIPCGYRSQTRPGTYAEMRTVTAPVWRGWSTFPSDNSLPVGQSLIRADAPDEATALQDFSGCRTAYAAADSVHPVADLGDEAFSTGSNQDVLLLVRRGRTYFVLSSRLGDGDNYAVPGDGRFPYLEAEMRLLLDRTPVH